MDLKQGAHKTPEFLTTLNSFGQVPVIDDGGTVLADSNAILLYLASTYGNGQWLPSDLVGQARVQRWLSAAAGPLHAGPATARLATVFGAEVDTVSAINRAHALLSVMEQQLSQSRFLASEQPSIADIAFYTYVAHAPEGNVSLADYLRYAPGWPASKHCRVSLACRVRRWGCNRNNKQGAPMDRFHEMQVFLAVAEEEGFAAAARRLNTSPPSVTRAIAAMEQRIGTQLLARTTRSLHLTEAGQRYLEDCRRILAELDEAEEAAAGSYSIPGGQLTVTAPVLFGELYVAPVLGITWTVFLGEYQRLAGRQGGQYDRRRC